MVFPRHLQMLYGRLEIIFRNAGYIAGKSGRHMKYPYTMSAKLAQFPYFHYMKHNNIWMYLPLGALGCLYVFIKIHMLANSDANVRNWAETQRRNAEKEHHD